MSNNLCNKKSLKKIWQLMGCEPVAFKKSVLLHWSYECVGSLHERFGVSVAMFKIGSETGER